MFQIGDVVRVKMPKNKIGEHIGWSSEMNIYNGQTARISKIIGFEGVALYTLAGIPWWFEESWIVHDSKTKYKKPLIERVIFNSEATIIKWSDGVKTVVKCQDGDTYDAEKGLAMAIAKRWFDNKGSFNDEMKRWLPDDPETANREDVKAALGLTF